MRNITLRAIATSIKKTLNLGNNVDIIAQDLINNNDQVIGIKISLTFYNADFWDYINKWSAWKNAYKYRKR